MRFSRIPSGLFVTVVFASLGCVAGAPVEPIANAEVEECGPPFMPATKWKGRFASLLFESPVPLSVGNAGAGETFAVQLLIGECPDERTEDCNGSIELEIVNGSGVVVLRARNESAVPVLANRLPGPRVTLPTDMEEGCYVARVWFRSVAGGQPLHIERGMRVVHRSPP